MMIIPADSTSHREHIGGIHLVVVLALVGWCALSAVVLHCVRCFAGFQGRGLDLSIKSPTLKPNSDRHRWTLRRRSRHIGRAAMSVLCGGHLYRNFCLLPDQHH